MTDATLFDLPPLPRVAPPGEFPRARVSDPQTSREAAREVAKGAKELELEIVRVVKMYGPLSAFGVAVILGNQRWDSSTVRTAVSRCAKARRIFAYDEAGVSPRGRACTRYDVRVERIETSVL